jgi:tetratricopeptide (TPR) repeat protein
MVDSKIIKSVIFVVLVFAITACADLSMYNQVPAPIGRTGEAVEYPSQPFPESAKTFPIDDQPREDEIGQSHDLSGEMPLDAQNPAVIALLDSAYQQSESGHLDIAASKLERAVRISPRDPQIWHALAKIRFQQNKYALAISLAKKSNLLSNNNKKLQRDNLLLMATCYDNLGSDDAARQARTAADRLF